MIVMKNIILLFVLLGLYGPVFSQATGPELEWEGQAAGEKDILLCNLEGKSFTIDVSLKESLASFKDGTYKLEYGNGSITEGLEKDDFPLRIEYNAAGNYSLVFSAENSDGVRLSTTYNVKAVKRPAINLRPVNTDVQCLGSEVFYLVDVYNENTSGTKYTLNYDDGSEDMMTNEELKANQGKFKHAYTMSYCHPDHTGSSSELFEVRLTVENECGSTFQVSMSYQEKVAEPIEASFTFSELNEGYACSFTPVKLHNTTGGGTDIDCSATNIKYEWDFGNGKKSIEFEPEITYKEVKEAGYDIRLIATNGYECARDTAYEHVVVVDRVTALIEPMVEKICSGNTVAFINNSTGGGRLYYYWDVQKPAGVPDDAVKFVQGTKVTDRQPEIQFDHYGEYTVTMIVNNGCSSATAEAKITVVEDPVVDAYFAGMNAELDSLCPQMLGEDLKINMADFAHFDWHGNDPVLQWTITPADGVTYEPGYGPDSEYPRFSLKPGKTYDISVELKAAEVNGVECGDPEKRKATQKLKVNDPVIVDDIIPGPAPGGDGVIHVCEGESVVFANNSTGENLRHSWSITPVDGEKCASNWQTKIKIDDPSAAGQTIVFGAYGTYRVTDVLSVHCYSETVSFLVRVGKAPTITYFNLGQDSLVCSGSVLTSEQMQGKILYAWYNNEKEVTWECSPGVEISDVNALHPELKFPAPGVYKIKASLNERSCPSVQTHSEEERTVRVRSSNLNCELSMDETEYCENVPVVISNLATDDEGMDYLQFSWSIEMDGEPYISDEIGSAPVLRLTELKYGSYKVTGRVVGYCDSKEDVVNFTVHKNPVITLKDRTFCPGKVTLAVDTNYDWWNNNPQVSWEIRREDGMDQPGDYEGSADALTQLYPEIDFKRPGRYLVKATLPHAGCPAIDPVEEVVFHVYDPFVYGDIVLKHPVAGQPTHADICENDWVEFENTMTEEAGGLSWKWSVETDVADGYEFMDGGVAIEESVGSVQNAPVIRFTKYGEYKLTVVMSSTCNPQVSKDFFVTVRGVPDITFKDKMQRVCAGDGIPVDMADYLSYNDRKNSTIIPEWTISPAVGFDWVPGYGADTDFPRIQFHDNAHYVIRLTAKSQCAEGGEQELSSEIDVISVDLQSIFSVGKDSVGCVDDPNPYEIILNNKSKGDSLEYTWTIQPHTGLEWLEGDNGTKSPKIRVDQEGNYEIKLHVTNGCNSDDSVFVVKAFARPTMEIMDIANECETFHFTGKDRVMVDEHNDKLLSAQWTITDNPGYPSEGYSLKNGTDLNSFFPDIDFNTCDYTVKVEYRNRCLTPGEATFQVKVDKFIPIQSLADGAICELAGARELGAFPEGGYWTLKEAAMPGGEKILSSKEGKYYFEPAFTAYEEKDIELVYHFQHLSCIARDTMNMHVWPLPFVEAGDPLEMCLNHEPVLLVGKDSVANGNWQSNRGQWTLGADVLEQHYFKAVTPGDFRLQYEYTYEYSDGTSCRNIDTTIMTVRELPNTGFTVEDKNCINLPVLFTPDSPANNQFEWSFGDNTTGQSEDTITHLYHDYGFREIICRAENQYHCKDTSEPKQIEIVNLPPPAFFDVDTLTGCAPFEVNITVDRSVYADDHNYLSFHWDYGEETVTDTLGPIVPKFYPSGVWDTTYVTTFTVSNMCGTEKYDTTITVYSVPKVSFALMHEWECAPVMLELQNTTTGNNCVFDWTFINKRTNETIYRSSVRNPQYEFDTDSASTTYYIRLRAENQCNVDTFTDSLVVKPRSISAHFTPLENPFACVNQEILFRNNSSDTVSTILNTYWNFGDGERTNEWSPSHKYDAAGTYLVSLKIDNGCGWDTISSPVNIYPLPTLKILSEDVLCEADTFTFVVKSDQELEHIEWKFGDGNRAYKDSLRYVYDGYGTFPVTVIGVSAEINQCTDSTWKEVVVNNKPIVTILPQDTMQCSPLLYAPQVTGDALLMWDYGDGTGQTSAQEHWYENPTDTVQKFRVKIYAETDKGCKSEYERSVAVYNNPRAALGKKVEKGNPQKVTFLNLSEEYTDIIWDLPFKGSLHSLDDQVVEFANNGTYTVGLIAESYYKCRDTTTLEHEVLIKGLYFPNTFIPHSLNGKINRFNGIGMGLLRYRLAVFDQYNNKIWETHALRDGKPSEGWDGCNAKGERMPQGIYIWRAEAIFGDDDVWTGKNNESGVPETTQGTVLLLRE